MSTSNPEIWTRFLARYYTADLLALATEYPERRSLQIDYTNIDKFNPALAEELLESPVDVLKHAGVALSEFALPVDVQLTDAHIRIMYLPDLVQIRSIRSPHISRLIAVDGLVRMATEVRPDITVAEFVCNGCGEVMYVDQESGRFSEPYACNNESCGRKGPFKLNLDKSEFIDVQRIRVQESPEDLRGGEQPQTLDVVFRDDLAGILSPGDHVIVTGVLRSYQRVTREGKSTTFDILLEAISIEQLDLEFTDVEITAEEEQEILKLSRDPDIYSRIISSIAPSIYGYDDIKEGLALQIMSGVSKHLPDGTRVRGDVHILLVGDPGIAKSQLLRYIIKLAPRGIYASGRSSSAVGLTASAVKSDLAGGDGRWVLEAGALVLADHGIAAIDEIDKMRAEDRSALHEAAEQQSITVAKAGILTTLKSRCAILAAANPKQGRFDPYLGIAEQIVISPALLSRFDLIYILKDEPLRDRDAAISDHILRAHYAGELHAQATRSPTTKPSAAQIKDAMAIVVPDISPELLRKYIAYAKKNVFPAMSEDIWGRLSMFYLTLRQQGKTSEDDKSAPIPTTARQLEALVRLCEASARLRLDERITLDDAERAIRVTMSCLKQVAYDETTGLYDIDIVSVGVSHSQRERIKILRNIIRDLSREHGGTAPAEEVAAQATAAGIDTKQLEQLLKNLKTSAEIYEPQQGVFGVL